MGLWLIVGVASKAKQPTLKETSMITTNAVIPNPKFGSETQIVPQIHQEVYLFLKN